MPFYSYLDVKPGQIVQVSKLKPAARHHLFTIVNISIGCSYMCVLCFQGTVQSLEKYGMHIKISDHIKGLVPRIHLADIILTNPEKKYSEGMRIKCKVSYSP